jgi:hypothetical protein
MSVGLVPTLTPAPPVERVLWRLRKGERIAEARIREMPHGQELRINVDGNLRWAQLYRSVGVVESATERHATFVALGWHDDRLL